MQFQNHAGIGAELFLVQLSRLPDVHMISAWTGNGGGNCFYSTFEAARLLLKHMPDMKFVVTTGVFRKAPELDVHEDIYHAWIELDLIPDGVLNRSRKICLNLLTQV